MDIAQFIEQYYIEPIVKHEGYNSVNTLTYAIIAIIAVYFVYRILHEKKISISEQFILNTIPFVLFGSTVRVVTDSIDSGVMKATNGLYALVLNSHIYDYGFLTSSPGIYIVTAVFFFISLIIAQKMKNERMLGYIGLILWIPHFFLLIPMMGYVEFAIPVIVLAFVPFYIAYRYFMKKVLAAIVGAHALDGAATFLVIDFFGKITGKSYFEQHVIPGWIGSMFGTFFPFYLLKIGIAFTAAWFIFKEKDASVNEKNFVALLLIIIGLAPGLRDLLRMVVGA